MRTTTVLPTSIATLALLALSSALVAATPVPTTQTPVATGTVAATTPTPVATGTVAATTPTPPSTGTTEPIPPTPGPPSPTPRLPEEGGPPGGVISGHVYIDNDGSGTYSPGDKTTGGTIIVEPLNQSGQVMLGGGGVATDASGYNWEIRGLPDGTYRVRWDPGLPRDQWPLAIPPVVEILLVPDPEVIIYASMQIVEIRGANRVTNIDFGIPPQPAVFGVQLPSTGAGGGGNSRVPMALLIAVLGVSLIAGLSASAAGRRKR